ncbi:unnamed protein product [Dicrocoelium dendriticum]|nr:unnamed protein product [Dicrocoelium dendriticum]
MVCVDICKNGPITLKAIKNVGSFYRMDLFRITGDDSDAFTEGEDDDEYKNSTISADDAFRIINLTIAKMDNHLSNLKRHQEILSRKSDELQHAVTELESVRNPSELVERFGAVRERIMVFKVVSTAMVNACTEFTEGGHSQIQRWRRVFNGQRERCAVLEQMVEQLARQLRHLETLVRQKNPHASLLSYGSNPNAPGTTGSTRPTNSNYSHFSTFPGQAIRITEGSSVPLVLRTFPTTTVPPTSTVCPVSSSVSSSAVISSPTTVSQLSPETESAARPDGLPVSTRNTSRDSSDEDFFDAEEVSEFSVYLPEPSAEASKAVDSRVHEKPKDDTRSVETRGYSRDDDDSSTPPINEAAYEYESDADLTEEESYPCYPQEFDLKTAKGLREARVIQARSKGDNQPSTLASSHGSAYDRTSEEAKGVLASETATTTIYVPVRKNVFKRRTTIPPRPNYSLNLWSIMKNCIGKELTKIPMPVNFSEPLSMLQRLTEDFEYSICLDRAALCQDSLEQMAYVAAFTVSSYATTAVRVNKPFNPLLGETYECDRTDDLGWRSIAEQVSHHPPKCALYCENNAWYCWFDFSMSTKFRGKYLQINPIGTCHLVFRNTGYHYTWKKIPMTVHNIIVGRLWIDNSGEMDIINHSLGEKCHLSYKAYSYFSNETPRRVTGAVTDRSGAVRYIINGTWDTSLEYAPVLTSRTTRNGKPVLETGDSRLLWQCSTLPPDADRMYFFTYLALQLNEEEEGVCPTDCRFRPDQRLMELGKWDEANREKVMLEEKQRDRRRQAATELAKRSIKKTTDTRQDMDPNSNTFTAIECLSPAYISSFLDQVDDEHKPLWFERRADNVTGEVSYHFNGKYWDQKAKSDWSMCPKIY